MKTVCVLGSPRTKGNSQTIAGYFCVVKAVITISCGVVNNVYSAFEIGHN